MKKKLLSVLLSLAMLLTLLPVSALAVDLTDEQKDALVEQGYTEEQIAELEADGKVMVIEEDTEIDADFDGLVLVMGSCTVTVKGAKVGVGLVVLPGAVDAKVVLTAAAEVNAVVLLDKGEVVVEEDAKATYLTLAAPEAAATVAGAVEKLTINEAADGAVVTVSGTVNTLTIDAPNTTTTVEAGASVATVNVGEKAENTEIAVDEAAEVGEINDEAGNVNGEDAEDAEDGEDEDGEDAEDEDKDAEDEDKDAEDEDKDAEDTKDEGTEDAKAEEPVETPEVAVPPVQPVPESAKTAGEKLVDGLARAPLVDHGITAIGSADGARNGKVNATKGDPAANGLANSYTIDTIKDVEKENTWDVIITGEKVVAHGASNGQGGCYVGVAIPHQTGYTYTYMRVTVDPVSGNTTKASVTPTVVGWTDEIGQVWDSFYYAGNMGTGDRTGSNAFQCTYEITITGPNGSTEVVTLNVTASVTAARTPTGEVVWTDAQFAEYLTAVNAA